MWIPLKHDQMLHLCMVREAKDAHHPMPPPCFICDEDSHWPDLLAPHFLTGVSDEINPSLGPHFWGDQPGEESLWHPLEVEGVQTREFINGCPSIHREWWGQTRICQKLFVAPCNLGMFGWWSCHPVKRAKSVRFVLPLTGSMEIPGRVLLQFGYYILGLILGLSNK